jgi:uncharacterized membrane protein YeiH
MLTAELQLPIGFDLFATFLFALTGALVAIRKGYDVIGVWVLALVTGVGGALIRDGIFIQHGPPLVLTDSRCLLIVTFAAVIGALSGRWLLLGRFANRFQIVVTLVDALGLGFYAVVGAEKASAADLGVVAAVLVGVTNAVGGGMLRDILVREEPMVFKPSQFYAVAALVGSIIFLVLYVGLHIDILLSAIVAIATAFFTRVLSVRLNWHTGPLLADED